MAKTEERNAHAHLQAVDAAKHQAPSAAADIRTYLDSLREEEAEIDAAIADVEAASADELAAIDETKGSELQAAADALRTDATAKADRLKEIEARFSFVLGTVTERTEIIEPLAGSDEVAPKSRAR